MGWKLRNPFKRKKTDPDIDNSYDYSEISSPRNYKFKDGKFTYDHDIPGTKYYYDSDGTLQSTDFIASRYSDKDETTSSMNINIRQIIAFIIIVAVLTLVIHLLDPNTKIIELSIGISLIVIILFAIYNAYIK